MKEERGCYPRWGLLIALTAFLGHIAAHGQARQEPGRVIGKVSTRGDLIVLELDVAVLGKANLFDLAGRTLRFTPEGPAYRAENLPSQWDPKFGSALSGPQATLRSFSFPFSGRSWDSFSVGIAGS